MTPPLPGDEGYVDPRDRDPEFPNRPNHPDFVLLSEVVQGIDLQSSVPGFNPFDAAGIDPASFMYFVHQRLGILSQAVGGRMDLDNPLNQGLYLDGFAAGKLFAEARRRKEG